MIILYILGGLLGLLLLYVLFLGVCCLLVDPKKEYEVNSPFYRGVLNTIAWWLVKVTRIKLHVTGVEKLPTDQRLVFVGNHRSNYDPIVTFYALKKWNIAFISKESNFKIPFLGRIVRKCCFMAIDRENPRNAIMTINKAADLIRRDEASVGVYPEGTRSKTGELLPFHNGVFKIAQKADVAIAVLCVQGTEQVAKRTPFRSTDVYLDVLEVIPADRVKATKTDLIGAEVRQLIETNIAKEER